MVASHITMSTWELGNDMVAPDFYGREQSMVAQTYLSLIWLRILEYGSR
jgi:hypothetical protein